MLMISLQHIRVRYGEDGMFGYKVIDLTDGKTILEYNVIGDMGSSSSVKVGCPIPHIALEFG